MAEFYRVEIRRSANRELESLGPDIGRRVLGAIQRLSSDPRPPRCEKLSGSVSSYRIRVGDYRILYEVDDNDRLITIFRVRHRRDAYQRR